MLQRLLATWGLLKRCGIAIDTLEIGRFDHVVPCGGKGRPAAWNPWFSRDFTGLALIRRTCVPIYIKRLSWRLDTLSHWCSQISLIKWLPACTFRHHFALGWRSCDCHLLRSLLECVFLHGPLTVCLKLERLLLCTSWFERTSLAFDKLLRGCSRPIVGFVYSFHNLRGILLLLN